MKTHPLLEWRLHHPVPIEDDIKAGDMVLLRKWERNPSRNSQGQDARIRPARTNYPYSDKEVQMLQRTPVRVLKTDFSVGLGGKPCVYVNMEKWLGRKFAENDHGCRWFLASDLDKYPHSRLTRYKFIRKPRHSGLTDEEIEALNGNTYTAVDHQLTKRTFSEGTFTFVLLRLGGTPGFEHKLTDFHNWFLLDDLREAE